MLLLKELGLKAATKVGQQSKVQLRTNVDLVKHHHHKSIRKDWLNIKTMRNQFVFQYWLLIFHLYLIEQQEYIIECKEITENWISRSLPHYLGRSLGKDVSDAFPRCDKHFRFIASRTFQHLSKNVGFLKYLVARVTFYISCWWSLSGFRWVNIQM